VRVSLQWMNTAAARQDEKPRIGRERRTVRHMVEIYCRDHHRSKGELCAQCDVLFTYAMARLDNCVYQDDKPTCKKCPVHCYKKDMRAEMREVMIYAGPRMLLSHPVLAIRHLLDERKDAPARPARRVAP
jgi:hypothetical protein